MEKLFSIQATLTCSSCSKACLLRLPVACTAWKVCKFIQKLSARGISKAPFFSVSLETFVLALRGPLGFFFEEARFSRFTGFFLGGMTLNRNSSMDQKGIYRINRLSETTVFLCPKRVFGKLINSNQYTVLNQISYVSYDHIVNKFHCFLESVVRPGLFPFPRAAWPTKSWEDSGKSCEPMNSKRNTDIMQMDLDFCLNT